MIDKRRLRQNLRHRAPESLVHRKCFAPFTDTTVFLEPSEHLGCILTYMLHGAL